MARTGQLYEVVSSFFGGFHWICTCGLKGNCYFPDKREAIADGGSHQCNVGWPASQRKSVYIGD